MRKIKFILIFFLIFLYYISTINAEVKLICLEKGETVKFFECNPSMEDRTCNSKWECQYCVDEISKGVYCPANINKCSNRGLPCEKIDSFSKNKNNSNNITININNQTNKQNHTTNSNIQNNSLTKKTQSNSETNSFLENNTIERTNKFLNSTKENKNTPLGGKSGNLIILFLSFTIIEFLVLVFLSQKIKPKKHKK